jgi:hypothetical protein
VGLKSTYLVRSRSNKWQNQENQPQTPLKNRFTIVPKGKGRGRSSKYTPECVETICDAIARTGSDKLGFEVGGISKATFYTWIEQHPDFSDAVIEARAEYRNSCPEVLVRQANKAFSDYLFGKMEKVVTTTESGSNSFGDYEKEIVRRIPVGIPRWAIERVLGPETDELRAIQVLARAGWLPEQFLEVTHEQFRELRSRLKALFEGILPTPNIQKSAGITDATADAIRREILGILPQNTPAVPAEVDSGQEPDQGLREVATNRD